MASQGLIQLREEPITWDVNYSSAFLLMAEKTIVEEHEELLVFDIEDLINGIGGALGLFLGWSILYLGKNKIRKSSFINQLSFSVSIDFHIEPTLQ